MEKVQISKGLLVSLAATAVVALLALVFILGLQCGRKGSTPQREGLGGPPASSPTSPGTQPASIPEGSSPAAAASAPPPTTMGDAVPMSASTSAVPPLSRLGSDDSVRSAVRAYFETIDHLQPGQMSGDAQGMAQEIASALVKGDTTGLDGMIHQAEDAQQRLASLAPPKPCIAYHQESLASLTDGMEMMRAMKKAVVASDPNALSGLTGKAEALRSRSERLEREGAALRQRYGLAH